MATQDAVRRIALSLPGVREDTSHFAFGVENKGKDKGIAWAWRERVHPKKARVPSEEVLAVRVANLLEKEALLAADEEKFFTEPHYNGYPAVLVRLAAVTEAELHKLITDAWECAATRELREGGAKAKTMKAKTMKAKTMKATTKTKTKATAKTAKKATTAKTVKQATTKNVPKQQPVAKSTKSAAKAPVAKRQPAARATKTSPKR
jgi:hypothetical protein